MISSPERKKILLTGGRSPTALFLARKFHEEGHEVFVAETSRFHICRFSNAVKKAFIVPSPRFQTEGFIKELIRIIEREGIDLYLPTYEEILYFSKAVDRFPSHCCLFIPSFDTLNHLHNKWLFHCKLLEMGMDAPFTFLVRSQEELHNLPFKKPYVVKPAYSRASQKVQKIDPGRPLPKIDIEPFNPWVAQEYLAGKKYCTYSLCKGGKLRAHCVYPIEYSIEGNSCLAFASIEHPEITAWVESFVAREGFTGQIAFDFIVTDEGRLYPIECNPRATSGLYLFDQPDDIHQMFFSEKADHRVIPSPGTYKQIAIGMLFYGWKAAYEEGKLFPFLKTLLRAEDVVFSLRDIKPFLSQPLVMATYWMQSRKWHLRVPSAFTFDTDWDNEQAQGF